MERITVNGLMDAHNMDVPLDPGTYEGVVDTQIKEGKEGKAPRLMVVSTIVDGPEQDNGSSPLEKKIFDFIPLGGYENMKDGGEFVKRKLANFLSAAEVEFDGDSFDPEDARGKHVLIKTTIREPDEYTPEPSVEVRRYLKA